MLEITTQDVSSWLSPNLQLKSTKEAVCLLLTIHRWASAEGEVSWLAGDTNVAALLSFQRSLINIISMQLKPRVNDSTGQLLEGSITLLGNLFTVGTRSDQAHTPMYYIELFMDAKWWGMNDNVKVYIELDEWKTELYCLPTVRYDNRYQETIVHGRLLEKFHNEREEGSVVFQRCGLLVFFDGGMDNGAMGGLIEEMKKGEVDSGESLGDMECDENGKYNITVI